MRDYSLPDLENRTILQIIPDLAAGGAERTTVEMAEAIVAAGGRAIVASQGGRLENDLKAVGGELVWMDASSKNPVTIRSNGARLAELITGEKIDLLHARSRAPAWSAKIAAAKTGKPFVTTYHGAYSGRFALKRKYNSVMASGDRVIANSDWIASHIRSVHKVDPMKLVTIPRGVDLERFDPASVSEERIAAIREEWRLGDPSQLVLLLPGRLTRWKGQLIAIEALLRLSPEERSGIRLILAGDPQGRDSYVAEIEELIDAAELSNTVQIAGHCSDMPAALLAADVALMPSLRPEAFGRVAPEASAMGRPVIASGHGGALETVAEGVTGTLIKPGASDELAGAVRAMRDIGPNGRAGMGEAGKRHVRERFSKRGLQIATLRVYSDLLEERRSAKT